jgi:hypothetical protein
MRAPSAPIKPGISTRFWVPAYSPLVQVAPKATRLGGGRLCVRSVREGVPRSDRRNDGRLLDHHPNAGHRSGHRRGGGQKGEREEYVHSLIRCLFFVCFQVPRKRAVGAAVGWPSLRSSSCSCSPPSAGDCTPSTIRTRLPANCSSK